MGRGKAGELRRRRVRPGWLAQQGLAGLWPQENLAHKKKEKEKKERRREEEAHKLETNQGTRVVLVQVEDFAEVCPGEGEVFYPSHGVQSHRVLQVGQMVVRREQDQLFQAMRRQRVPCRTTIRVSPPHMSKQEKRENHTFAERGRDP